MSCRNPERPSICLCPIAGYTPRDVLAAQFINGWVSEVMHARANKLARDTTASEQSLWQMLFEVEERASDAFEMWKNYQ